MKLLNNGNNGNNGKDQKEMFTRIHCAWNPDHEVEAPAEKGIFGYKPAAFPERWQVVDGEVLCEHCAEVARNALKKAREQQAKSNGRKSKAKTTSN